MKISQNTLSLLQNFASINSNLLVKEGNKLATRNAVNSVQARAVVDEEFPVQFAIYDLNQVLGLLSASQDPEIEFEENRMLIKSSNGGEIEYFYADASLITAPPADTPKMEVEYSFKLTSGDITSINKIGSLVSATTISVVGDGKAVTLLVNDPKNKSSNSFKKVLGTSQQKFDVKMSVDALKVVSDTYDVDIAQAIGKAGKVLIFFLTSTTKKLNYLIAADATSKI